MRPDLGEEQLPCELRVAAGTGAGWQLPQTDLHEELFNVFSLAGKKQMSILI